MDSHIQHHQQLQQVNSGLTRYRSAPSSFFASFLSSTASAGACAGAGSAAGYVGDDLDHLINSRVSNRDDFSRFMSNVATQDSNSMDFARHQQSTASDMTMQSHLGVSVKAERETRQQPQQLQLQQQERINDYSLVPKMYQNQSQAQHGHNLQASASAMDNSYRFVASINSNDLNQMKTGGARNSSLIRHSSSPAGLFDQINIEYEYGAIRGIGNFRVGNNAKTEASVSSSSRFKKDVDFSSGRPSSFGEMTVISESETKSMGDGGSGKGGFGENHRNDDNYITGFADASWDDSGILSDEFLKGLGDDDQKLFSSVNTSDSQNDGQNRPPNRLSHHLSLPTSSAELSVLDKISEDTILCKIRAKRGCATHPRSIAERVRRTRISERMRKLQELVPNMEKQTNTADMLDLAVDYIKDLEKHLKVLQANRAKCTCSK